MVRVPHAWWCVIGRGRTLRDSWRPYPNSYQHYKTNYLYFLTDSVIFFTVACILNPFRVFLIVYNSQRFCMILGIGIDLFEVQRMHKQLEAPEDGFITSVFLPSEISYCQQKHYPAQHFAARFAAKEATLKALASTGGQGTFWLDIEISNASDGRPIIELSGRLSELAREIGTRSLHVSLTHTATQAGAVVIAED